MSWPEVKPPVFDWWTDTEVPGIDPRGTRSGLKAVVREKQASELAHASRFVLACLNYRYHYLCYSKALSPIQLFEINVFDSTSE